MSMSSRMRSRGGSRRKGRGPGALGLAGGLIKRGLRGRGKGRPSGRRGRAKGISGTELRGFRRVAGLLGKLGMVPRKLKGARPMRRKR